ncbi:MAG: hypothetical protein HC850_12005 [Rhodomicrobium sp.]|nr:hypothetical protein [Rhodomicrobium sp.]
MTPHENHPRSWLEVRPEGLYCAPARAFIDPVRAVDSIFRLRSAVSRM